MINYWYKLYKSDRLTENLEFDSDLKTIRKQIKHHINKKFSRSLAIRSIDSGGCNACLSEAKFLSNPYYNLERLGLYFVASPRHADVLLLSGVMTQNMVHPVMNAYQQIPNPKWVITLGDCPLMRSPIEKTFAIEGNITEKFPNAFHIEGCPPSPKQIMQGLLEFLKNIDNTIENSDE